MTWAIFGAIGIGLVFGFVAGSASRDKEVARLIESAAHDSIRMEEQDELLKQCRRDGVEGGA